MITQISNHEEYIIALSQLFNDPPKEFIIRLTDKFIREGIFSYGIYDRLIAYHEYLYRQKEEPIISDYTYDLLYGLDKGRNQLKGV